MLIFSSVAGSRLYGLNNAQSDTDVRGVFLAPRNQVLGIVPLVDTQELSEPDTVYHELRKFLRLAAKGNPTIIELLFTPESHWLSSHVYWNEVHQNRSLFLTEQTKQQYTGYIYSELSSIKKDAITHKPVGKRLSQIYRLLYQLDNILHLRDCNPVLEGQILTKALELRYNELDLDKTLFSLRAYYYDLVEYESHLPKNAPIALISNICEEIYKDWLKV